MNGYYFLCTIFVFSEFSIMSLFFLKNKKQQKTPKKKNKIKGH